MKSILYNILIAIDQLGNTFAGGHSDNTISARVGAYASDHKGYRARKYSRWYWLMLQKIINVTFYPIDGEGHCHMAFHKEAGTGFQAGSNTMKVVLSLIIIATCIPFSILFYLLYALQIIKPNQQNLSDIEIEGFKKVDEIIFSAFYMTEESEDLPKTVLEKAEETKIKLDDLILFIKSKTA